MQRTRVLVLVATFAAVAAFVSITNGAASLSHNTPPPDQSDVSKTEDRTGPRGGYVVIGWNDLGMHCISPSFDKMAILPPYNNLMAQVIQKGNPPRIITSGVTVEYSIKGNTTVHNKTNFWQYVQPLFGVNPPEGIGLTGKGLAGLMDPVGDHFEAIGIPTVPKDDAFTFYPFQQGLLTVRDSYGSILATNDVTVPVSDELHCDYCHYANGPGAPGINTGSIDGNILRCTIFARARTSPLQHPCCVRTAMRTTRSVFQERLASSRCRLRCTQSTPACPRSPAATTAIRVLRRSASERISRA